MPEKVKVLFICLGNICRSPLAEVLFANHLRLSSTDHLFELDSCGTGNWHQGEPADERVRKIAERHALPITHKARQITSHDFEYYDYLLVMDYQNLADVKSLNAEWNHKVSLLTDYSDDYRSRIIPDPYFGDIQGFESVFNLLEKVIGQVANTIIHQYQAKP